MANGDVATIESSGPAWIAITFTYNNELKDELMIVVGRGNYKWVKETKQWLVRHSFHDAVVELFESYEYSIDDYVQYRPSPPQAVATSNPWLKVFGELDSDLAHKLYRAATRTLHPDAGGTDAAMRLLNAAWASKKR